MSPSSCGFCLATRSVDLGSFRWTCFSVHFRTLHTHVLMLRIHWATDSTQQPSRHQAYYAGIDLGSPTERRQLYGNNVVTCTGAGRYSLMKPDTYTHTHKNHRAAGVAVHFNNFPFISLLQQKAVNDSLGVWDPRSYDKTGIRPASVLV